MTGGDKGEVWEGGVAVCHRIRKKRVKMNSVDVDVKTTGNGELTLTWRDRMG